MVWYTKGLVTARAARHTLGTDYNCLFDVTNPLHRARIGSLHGSFDGALRLPSCFDVLIKKVGLLTLPNSFMNH